MTLGKKKCICSFDLKTNGAKCSGKASCNKMCSGTGTVKIGRFSFSLRVKKGKAQILKCKAVAGPGPGSGPGSGSGPSPPISEEMQCSCKCNCPKGGGECDCDCNCPMQSSAMNCSSGFTRVCPMMGNTCPVDMDMICPMNAQSKTGNGNASGTGKGNALLSHQYDDHTYISRVSVCSRLSDVLGSPRDATW